MVSELRKTPASAVVLLMLAAASAFASGVRDPVPILEYDFTKEQDGAIKDTGGGLELKLGEKTKRHGGALVFNGKLPSEATIDSESFTRWAREFDMREFSASFWIRFDSTSRSSTGSSALGFFDCRIGKDSLIEVVLQTHPTEIMASELVMRSKTTAKRGEWYHVELSFSANRRRYALYIDGHWQMENDNLLLPAIALGRPRMGHGFKGAVKDIRLYDIALASEELALVAPSEWLGSLHAAILQNATTKNKGLNSWASDLRRRYQELEQNIGRTTIAQMKRLRHDIDNFSQLLKTVGDNEGAVDVPLATFVMSATSQDLMQPYDLPRYGKATDKIKIYAAQGEYESTVLMVVPFQEMKGFTLRMSDLKSGGNILEPDCFDAKLIKRWYRTGGAWMNYHADKRQRVLVPDLLINDDSILRVDEVRDTNEMLMRYPGDTRYVDISRYGYTQTAIRQTDMPFWDASTLQPTDLPEPGRNQPYCLTFHVPDEAAPGLYSGTLELLSGDQVVTSMMVDLRVLPFSLPNPKTYYDIERDYYSHINRAPLDSMVLYSNALVNLRKYNLLHCSNIDNTPWQLKIAKGIGYPLQMIFNRGSPTPRDWKGNFGGPGMAYLRQGSGLIGTNDYARLDRLFKRDLRRKLDQLDSFAGTESSFINVAASEISSYGVLVIDMEQGSDAYHESGRAFMMTHSMRDAVPFFTADFNDLDSATRISREWADLWHAAGGRIMNYANPFPSAENPAWYRRRIGLQMYKTRYDGQMLHGYIGRFWNEFAEWPGGDGNYRSFCLAYPQKDSMINTLALVGVREAYDDVRYATKLMQLAQPHLESSDVRLAREAKRQLLWLEQLDGERADLDAFRIGVVHRILTMMELMGELEGEG